MQESGGIDSYNEICSSIGNPPVRRNSKKVGSLQDSLETPVSEEGGGGPAYMYQKTVHPQSTHACADL